MTETMQYTDEILIAHLMGEGEPEFRAAIERNRMRDPRLASRLAVLESLCGVFRQLPVDMFYRARRPVNAWSLVVRTALLAGIFFTGVLAQSQFSLLDHPSATPDIIHPAASGDFPFSSRIVM